MKDCRGLAKGQRTEKKKKEIKFPLLKIGSKRVKRWDLPQVFQNRIEKLYRLL